MPTNSSPLEPSLSSEESQLTAAREHVAVTREALDECRTRLSGVDQLLRRLWQKRKAALGSFEATERAQHNSGMTGRPLAKLSLARIEARATEALKEIHELVSSSESVCNDLYSAWETYISARKVEAQSLESIAAAQAPAVSEETRYANRRREARAELIALERVRKNEETERRKDFALDNDGHFDPNYDERELLVRRMRPWV